MTGTEENALPLHPPIFLMGFREISAKNTECSSPVVRKIGFKANDKVRRHIPLNP